MRGARPARLRGVHVPHFVQPLQQQTAFVGLSNYMSAILHDGFLSALRVTLIVVAAAVVIQFPLGYLLASCLNRRPRGYRGIQTVLLLPLMLTPVAVGEVWLFIFDPSIGVARYFASPVAHNLSLLGTPATALCVIIFVDTWINTPFVMVMILAGMSGLPPDPREAARLDGASSGQLLRFITLPALRPVLLVTLLLRVINAFQVFDIIYVLTLGGPGTSTTSLGLLVYQDTFQFFTTGAGAAVAVAMVIIELPVYIAFTRFTRASFT